jgi:hypothetical protein
MKRTVWNRLLAFDDPVLVLIIPSLGDMDVDTMHQVIFGGDVNELHRILGGKPAQRFVQGVTFATTC